MKNNMVIAIVFFVLLALVTRVLGNALINIWFMIIDPVYVIPNESSIFRFEATQINSGSGDWWEYGEDNKYYYHYSGEETHPYVTYPKVLSKSCVCFQATEIDTWCAKE